MCPNGLGGNALQLDRQKKLHQSFFFSLGPNVSTQLQRKKFAGTRRVKKDSIAVITKKFSGTDCVK